MTAREWLTAQELAALALAALPSTRFGVTKLARREGWGDDAARCRPRAGRGGGLEYHVSLLPLPARVDLVRRGLAVVPDVAREGESAFLRAAVNGAERRDARLAAVAAADRFRREAGLASRASDAAFARAYGCGQAVVPDWARAALGARLSVRSLARWRAAARSGAAETLCVDPGATRRGTGVLETAAGGAVATHILALIVHQPHLSADHVRTLVRATFGDALDTVHPATGEVRTRPVPPVRTFQHFLKRLRAAHKVDLTALTNPDEFRSRYRIAGRGTLAHVTRPNQLWQIDASPADVLLVGGRHAIYVATDIATRRTLVYATRTPRAEAVAMLIRRAILAWGVPAAIKTDNGSDFKARATERLFAALDIEPAAAPAYTPEAKGHVERVIRTLQHDLMPLLPGFIGHNVTERKAIEARRSFAARLGTDDADTFAVELTLDAFQAYCDQWAETRYQHRPHSGLKGRTPFEAAAAARETVRTVAPRALDMLIAPVAGGGGYRTVTKFGVRVDGNHYLAPGIAAGSRVFVRRDPADLGRAWLFAGDGGEFLAEALCPALAGIDPAEALASARAEQKRFIEERTAAARAAARRIAKGPALAELVLRQAAADHGALVAFPALRRAHVTPAISAAADAAQAADGVPAPEPRHSAEAIRLAADYAAGWKARARPKTEQELMHERWDRALAIEDRLAAGEAVAESDLAWHRGYAAGSEYHALDVAYRGAAWRGAAR